MASLTFTFQGEISAQVTVTENGAGGLIFDIAVLGTGGTIGDLRALYFDVSNESLLAGLTATGADVTGDKFSANSVTRVHSADTNINGQVIHEFGKFDGGVQFGTPGTDRDDIQTTQFVLTHDSIDLSLDLIALQDFGLRATSVGEEDGCRHDSVKLGATAPDIHAINLIVGDEHPNMLVGTAGVDIIRGLGDDDFLQGLGGDDTLEGGDDFDTASYSDATAGIAVVLANGTVTAAGAGTDTLTEIERIQGTAFADSFDATGFIGITNTPSLPVGVNAFEGMAGDDTIVGNGWTQIQFINATDSVFVDIAAGVATGDSSVGTDTFSGVYAVSGSNFDDVLLGGDNVGFMAQYFDGRAGNDFIDGRGGTDRAVYNNDFNVTSGIEVHLADGLVIGNASVGTDTLRSVEEVRGTNFADTFDATGFSGLSTNAGSAGTQNSFEGMGGDDTIIGNGNTRIVYGFAKSGVTVDIAAGTAIGDASVGSDTFSGVNGVFASFFDDTLFGSENNDGFFPFAGDDLIDGRGGIDNVSFGNPTFVTGGINVDLAAGVITGDASIGTDTLVSIEGIQGSFFDDTYVATGFVGLNQFQGMAGNDIISGNGNTQLLFFNATGGVTVDMEAGISTGNASVGTDLFSGVDTVQGSNFSDVLLGDDNFNRLQGMSGNDTLEGRGGSDFLSGGAGADTFVFNADFGNDFITDFTAGSLPGHDILDFDASIFADFAAVQGAMSEVGGHVQIDTGTNSLLILNTALASLEEANFSFS